MNNAVSRPAARSARRTFTASRASACTPVIGTVPRPAVYRSPGRSRVSDPATEPLSLRPDFMADPSCLSGGGDAGVDSDDPAVQAEQHRVDVEAVHLGVAGEPPARRRDEVPSGRN